jgi:hypothetical protein
MRKLFFFGVASLLLFSFSAAGQTQSQNARLVKMTATVSVHEREISHTNWTSATLVSEKIVTYHFVIRSGGVEYTSVYTPDDQPGTLPHAWWVGNAPVGIRIANHKLYIILPDGREVRSNVTGQTSTAKS